MISCKRTIHSRDFLSALHFLFCCDESTAGLLHHPTGCIYICAQRVYPAQLHTYVTSCVHICSTYRVYGYLHANADDTLHDPISDSP
ncbi:hypothetical protein F5Y15DRAFT_269143 [Xylariaceae sp. FL0016]|nr:hypothetical protein F5Y15DRAFT_269143 [Xylariaceae sp. FL0016]